MTHPAHVRDAVIEAYTAGTKVFGIEHLLRVNRGTFYSWLDRAGVPRRSQAAGYDHGAFERRAQPADVTRLHAEGLSDCAIGRELGVTAEAIRKVRHLLSLPANFNNARRVKFYDVESLHAAGLSDYTIGQKLGVSHVAVYRARRRLNLAPNFKGGRHLAVLALALMLLAPAAAATPGWQGHDHNGEHDPFRNMMTAAGGSCCHSKDCAFTEECTIRRSTGVIGPDGQCHEVTDFAIRAKNCAVGQTSACFVGSVGGLKMLCACLGGV